VIGFRYRSPSQSSVTASSQGDADSERPDHDPDDIIVDNKLTNKPLTELLKASSSKDAHTEVGWQPAQSEVHALVYQAVGYDESSWRASGEGVAFSDL